MGNGVGIELKCQSSIKLLHVRGSKFDEEYFSPNPVKIVHF